MKCYTKKFTEVPEDEVMDLIKKSNHGLDYLNDAEECIDLLIQLERNIV